MSLPARHAVPGTTLCECLVILFTFFQPCAISCIFIAGLLLLECLVSPHVLLPLARAGAAVETAGQAIGKLNSPSCLTRRLLQQFRQFLFLFSCYAREYQLQEEW